MLSIILGRFRTAVLKAAAENKDPFDWTQSMLEFVPSDNHAQILAFANANDWFARLFGQANADATKHLEFLLEVRNAILLFGFHAAAVEAKGRGTKPEEFAKQFLAWSSPSFREELAGLVREPENFADVFSQDPANLEWAEQLRKSLVTETESLAHASNGDASQ